MRCSSKWVGSRFVRILTAVCAIRAASIGLVSASSDETSAVGVSLPLSEVAEIRHGSGQYPIAPLKGTEERIANNERDLKQTEKGAKKKAKAAATKKGMKKKARIASGGNAKKMKTRQHTANGGSSTRAADLDQTKNEDDKNTRSNNMVVSNASGLGGASESDSTEVFMEKFYGAWDRRGGTKNKNNRGGGRNKNARRGNKGRGRRRKRQRPGQGWSGGGRNGSWNGGKPKDHDNWQSSGSGWDTCPCTYVDAPSWWGGSSGWNSGGRNLAGSGSKAGKAYYGRGDGGGGGKGFGGGDSEIGGNGGGNNWSDGGGKGWGGGGGGGKGKIKVCTCMPTYFP